MKVWSETIKGAYRVFEPGTRLVLTTAEAEARRAEFSPPAQTLMAIGPAGDGLVLVELVARLVLEPGVTVMVPDENDDEAVVADDTGVTK